MKTDIRIGQRAATEVKRLYPRKKDAVIAVGCGNHVINEWSYGIAPSARYLARLHELGADVIYILSGVRTAK